MFLRKRHFPFHRITNASTRCLLGLVFLGISIIGTAQSKAQLEKDRRKIIQEIEKTNDYLKSTQKEKSSALKDIKALNNQVSNRKKLISTVQKEIESAADRLIANEEKRDSINTAYTTLVNQYTSILRHTYFEELSNQKLAYLLSSESLNTFLLRYQYLQQFQAYQSAKKTELVALRAASIEADELIKIEKEEQLKLLDLEKDQFAKLEKEKKSKDRILSDISDKESELKGQLTSNRKKREKLNKSIEAIILAELKKATARKESKDLSKADTKLSGTFSKNKGKFPWPVSNGFVSTRFGKQAHPTLKGISIESNGVDISCTGSMTVKSIAKGTVVGITKVASSNNMVILRHGDFYTVYSNLTDVVIRKGNDITPGQVIGSLSNGSNGRGELHFEIWKDKVKMDPQKWLKR